MKRLCTWLKGLFRRRPLTLELSNDYLVVTSDGRPVANVVSVSASLSDRGMDFTFTVRNYNYGELTRQRTRWRST